jgi:ABC-type transport system substrate-binding protein
VVAALTLGALLPFAGTASAATKSQPSAPGSVRIAWPEAVATLDPDRTTDILPVDILHLIGGTLTALDAQATGATPGLAKTWNVTPDGLRWTFVLRSGLRFSDGTPLTASDVKATFERQMTDKSDPNLADFSEWKQINVVSPTELTIQMAKPEPSLPLLLASPGHSIFPATSSGQGEAFFRDPVSDGPYKLKSITPGGTAETLVANRDYYGAQPAVRTVVFSYVPNDNTRVIELRAHQIDVAGELSPTDLPQITSSNLVARVARQFGAYQIWISDRKSPLSNVNVRKAISDAIDRSQIDSIVWHGADPPLGGLFPDTMSQYVNNIPTAYNPSLAKKLLKGTPCARGCTIPMLVRTGYPIEDQTATIIQQDVQPIGINIEIQSVDNAVQSQDLSNANFQMALNWFGLSVADPITYLNYAVLSSGGINALFSGWNSPQANAAVERAATTSGSTEAAAISDINRIFARDLPYIPLVDYATVIGLSKSAAPFVTLGADSMFNIASK